MAAVSGHAGEIKNTFRVYLVHSKPNFKKVAVFVLFRCTVLILLSAFTCLSSAQEKARSVSTNAVQTLSRVQVPDVRGLRPEEAQRLLTRIGLQPGATSSALGPGIVGTVLQQDPVQGSLVSRGTTFKLVLVAPPARTNPRDQFFTQVPGLIGLTPNQASNLLEGKRLLLGNVSGGDGSGPEGTIYGQKPQAGGWAKIGSTVEVVIVAPRRVPDKPKITWVFVPNLY